MTHTLLKPTNCKGSFSCFYLLFALFLLITAGNKVQAQSTGVVRGVISQVDEKGEPIPGVTILVKGTLLGVATHADGSFVLTRVPAGGQTLVISALGYTSAEMPVTVVAGREVQANLGLKSQSTQLGEVVVTGLRRTQLESISRKRQALNTREVITSDDLGRLPDINVAEATQRVAGVNIETNRGEGQFVSIRGVQPALNNVTLNNTNIASTSNSRATPLDLMPTEIISSIEVIKTNTPDMEGNAIGGTVNINTVSAFDKKKPFMVLSVDGLVQTQQVDLTGFDRVRAPFRGAVTAGKRFGKQEKFGAVVSANFFRRDFSASILDPDGWVFNRYFYPNEIELQIEDIERDRASVSADFEYRATPNNSVYLKTLYTRTNEVQKNSEFELTMQIGAALPLEQTPTSGRFARGSGELDQAYTNEIENLSSYTFGTRNRFGKLSTDVYGTYSRAATTLNNFDATFENPTDTEPRLSLRYNTAPYFFEILPEDPAFASNPEIYKLRNLNFTSGTIEENLREISADLRYDLKLGATPAYIKFGGRYRDRSKIVDRSRDSYDLSFGGVTVPNNNAYSLTPFFFPVSVPAQGGAQPFVHGVVNKFKEFIETPGVIQNRQRLIYDTLVTQQQMYVNDINNSEGVLAGYAMGVIDFRKLTIIAGLRMEQTTTESNRTATTQFRGRLVPSNVFLRNTYTSLLPSIQLKYNLTSKFLIRAAWTNTLGRPDYSALAATSVFNYAATSNTAVFTGSLALANPDLRPYESSNFDLSFENYFPSGGIVAVGGFYKRVDNQIYRIQDILRNTQYDGKTFEQLTVTQNVNADAADLYGVEFTYDQAFTFLPKFLEGLGLSANFALIGSRVSLPNRSNEDLPLLRQASNVYNAALYYQKRGFEFRFATSHRSAYLTEAANATGYTAALAAGVALSEFDRYDAARTTYDVTASQFLYKKKLRILAQVRNLTNAPEAGYQGNVNRYDRHDLTGRSYFLGVSLNL
ncbi:MAG: TonB-dependent receptor [Cytophagales bacterium]|nr:MAG: TonB-dependent receptor [Cytophagales bacterium]